MRKIFFPILISIISLNWSALAQIPTNGLTAHYPFSGNANDISGYNNNGTVYGAVLTTDRYGNDSSAYLFDGIDDYIQTLWGGPYGDTSRTFSFWAKTDSAWSPGIYGMATISYGFASSGGARYEILMNNGCDGFGIDVSNGIIQKSSATVSDNNWHHYAVVYDKSISTQIIDIKYYLDGSLYSSSNCVSGTPTQNVNTIVSDPYNIGRLFGPSDNRNFKGKLDDFIIYDRALDQSEINDLYSDPAPCTDTIYDTVRTVIYDTVYIFDTTHVFIYDTISIYDTVHVFTYDSIAVTDTLLIDINITGGISPNDHNVIKIYPNPANDHIYIDNGNYAIMNTYILEITNNTGQQIFQALIDQPSFYIDLSTFGGSGLYYVNIYDSLLHKIDTRKIILY